MTVTREQAAAIAAEAVATYLRELGYELGGAEQPLVEAMMQGTPCNRLLDGLYVAYNPIDHFCGGDTLHAQVGDADVNVLPPQLLSEEVLHLLREPITVESRILAGVARWWKEYFRTLLPERVGFTFPRAIKRGYPYSIEHDGVTVVVGQADPLGYLVRVFYRVADQESDVFFEGALLSEAQSMFATEYVQEALGGEEYPGTKPAPVFADADDTAARIGAVVQWLWRQDMSLVPYPASQQAEFVASLRSGIPASVHGIGEFGNARITVGPPDDKGYIVRVDTRFGFAEEPKWRPYRYSTVIFSRAVEELVGREAVLKLFGG